MTCLGEVDIRPTFRCDSLENGLEATEGGEWKEAHWNLLWPRGGVAVAWIHRIGDGRNGQRRR